MRYLSSLISPSPPVEAVSGRPGEEEFQGQGSLEAAFLARQDVICLDSSDSSEEEEKQEDVKPPAIPIIRLAIRPAVRPAIRDGKTVGGLLKQREQPQLSGCVPNWTPRPYALVKIWDYLIGVSNMV